MTLVAVPGRITFPDSNEVDTNSTGTAAPNTNSMNIANEYCGAIFIAPASLNLRKIGFYVLSTSSFLGTADARVETVSAGVPTGTPVGTGTVFVPAATTWFWVTMTVDAALTAGTRYYAGTKVTAVTSGSFVQNQSWNNCFNEALRGVPYAVSGTAPTLDDDAPILGLEDDTGAKILVRGMYPTVSGLDAESWSSSSNPDRRGLRFKLTFPARITGVQIWGDHDQNLTVILYDSDGATVLASTAFVAADRSTATDEFDTIPLTPTVLTKDTFYRLVVLPTTTTARNNLYATTVANAADLDCLQGGQNFHWTTANGAPANEASWTNTTTKRPLGMSMMFDQLDDGTGGTGGGLKLAGRAGLAG